ncbi:MAG: magnesium chelatase subunit D, partial [Burkholderiaceae bacterium]
MGVADGDLPEAPIQADAEPLTAWADALRAAWLLAVDPHGLGGMAVRAGHGPVREQLLTVIRSLMPKGSAWRRVPIHAGDDRLLGGLDLTATLAAGRPVGQAGLLAEADGGMLVLAMAERVAGTTASRLCAALDTGECALARDGLESVRAARFGVIALDEGTGDDGPPPAALLERLAFRVDLTAVSMATMAALGDATDTDAQAVADARLRLASVGADDEVVSALCAVGLALGVASVRATVLALRAARAAAALDGRDRVDAEDAALAARLVLAPRATRWPTPAESASEQTDPPDTPDIPEPPDGAAPGDPSPPVDPGEPPPVEPPEAVDTPPAPPPPPDDTVRPDRPLDEVVLEAARAAIPAGLLAGLALLANGRSGDGSGRAGVMRASMLRGRPTGARPGLPRDGARLALVDTLRAAAPWQSVRRRAPGHSDTARIALRADDLRVARRQQRTETTTIFAIDASGSSALHRLAEAKGAVELLLADCYVRRDRVSVLAFRARGAEVLLPPTRSLVRAKRSLAGLPGGGGTPLAAGIDAAAELAAGVARRGGSPVIVLLTDGRANVARDGTGGRAR